MLLYIDKCFSLASLWERSNFWVTLLFLQPQAPAPSHQSQAQGSQTPGLRQFMVTGRERGHPLRPHTRVHRSKGPRNRGQRNRNPPSPVRNMFAQFTSFLSSLNNQRMAQGDLFIKVWEQLELQNASPRKLQKVMEIMYFPSPRARIDRRPVKLLPTSDGSSSKTGKKIRRGVGRLRESGVHIGAITVSFLFISFVFLI